jgi:hypothetical protein
MKGQANKLELFDDKHARKFQTQTSRRLYHTIDLINNNNHKNITIG